MYYESIFSDQYGENLAGLPVWIDIGELDTRYKYATSADGIVFADRSFKAGSYEMKAAYQPIRTTYDNDVLSIYNRFDFTNLNEYTFKYEDYKLADDLADERDHHNQCEDANEDQRIPILVLKRIELSEKGEDSASNADEKQIHKQFEQGFAHVIP